MKGSCVQPAAGSALSEKRQMKFSPEPCEQVGHEAELRRGGGGGGGGR